MILQEIYPKVSEMQSSKSRSNRHKNISKMKQFSYKADFQVKQNLIYFISCQLYTMFGFLSRKQEKRQMTYNFTSLENIISALMKEFMEYNCLIYLIHSVKDTNNAYDHNMNFLLLSRSTSPEKY